MMSIEHQRPASRPADPHESRPRRREGDGGLPPHAHGRSGLLFGAALTAGACVLLWVACFHYFQQGFFDDSFITLRYVRHLRMGYGLVWNVGEPPTEGFTNIAWVVLLALVGTADADHLVEIAKLAGVILGMGTLCCAWLATRALLPPGQQEVAGLVPLHLALTPLFSRHALSGMETMMTGFLLLLLVLAWCAGDRRRSGPGYAGALAVLTFLAFLSRPDALLFGVSGTAARLLGREDTGRRCVRGLSAYAGTLGTLLAVYMVWKYWYFGALIPLPAYMKARPDRILGSPDLIRFVLHHWLGFLTVVAPLLVLPGLAAASGRLPRSASFGPIAVALCVYGVYFLGVLPVMSVHWRYLFPLYAPLAVLAAACLGALLAEPRAGRVTIRQLGGAGLALLFAGYNVGNFHDLRHVARAMYQDHVKYGRIGKELAPFPGISVAVSEVGQLPYHADCRVLDLSGLNDAFIVRNRFRDPRFTERFGEYLRRGFGLPDIYVDPPVEYHYADLRQHPEIAREYLPLQIWGLRVHVLRRSRFREPLLARLGALTRRPPPPSLPLTG